MRVLIAYDGSAYADAALADLYRAGLHDVEARVLSVTELWLPPPDMLRVPIAEDVRQLLQTHQEQGVEQASVVADRAASWLREHFSKWHVEAVGRAGSPVEQIIREAESWPADLVVIGAHGRLAAQAMFPGSVCLAVLRHVSASVRLARRPQLRGSAPTRLIVGIDGSADSQVVLGQVRCRVWPAATQLRVLTVVDTRLIPLVIPGLSIGPTCDEWARRIADEAADSLRECGLNAFSTIERGDPKHVITDAARTWDANCVFIGAQGLTRLPWLRLGSVSTAIAMRARCSVEVVRPVKAPQERESDRKGG